MVYDKLSMVVYYPDLIILQKFEIVTASRHSLPSRGLLRIKSIGIVPGTGDYAETVTGNSGNLREDKKFQ